MVSRHLTETAQAIAALRTPEQVAHIEAIADGLRRYAGGENIVWCVGNGGSQAAVQHLVLHLREHSIRAFDMLADNAMVTAITNDNSFPDVTNSLAARLGSTGDALVVISGSGNSINTELAAQQIGGRSGTVFGLLGMGGGKLLQYCDEAVVVPSDNYGPIEDCHLAVIHAIHAALSGTA